MTQNETIIAIAIVAWLAYTAGMNKAAQRQAQQAEPVDAGLDWLGSWATA